MSRKTGIVDNAFLPKMIESCDNDNERGLVYTLYYTGMHGSSLLTLSRENLKKEGERFYLKWRRPKTNKQLEASIPAEKVGMVGAFLDSKKKTVRWYNYKLKMLGDSAGYDDVSTMTFRHTRCLRMIKEGRSLFAVQQMMGCSQEVIWANYAKMTDEQLRE